MGYSGKLREKQLAISLRVKGLSYRQIQEIIPVSKSSLSLWCRDVVLTVSQMENLQKRKLEGSKRGSIIGAKRQQNDRIIRTKNLLEEGRREVGKLSRRERFVAGIGLYAGDGDKGDKAVGFANSNPDLIVFMMRWLRDFCNVSENRFRGKIWIHEGSDVKKAIEFWSKKTNIPISQFQKPYISKVKKDSKKIRKKIHEFGVFSIRIADSSLQRKLLGFMTGLLE